MAVSGIPGSWPQGGLLGDVRGDRAEQEPGESSVARLPTTSMAAPSDASSRTGGRALVLE
jgi:hypothetical protein